MTTLFIFFFVAQPIAAVVLCRWLLAVEVKRGGVK
jgi:hypothetical protein